MQFAGLEKSWILEKIAEVMEESWNYIFWSKDLVLFENWKTVLVVELQLLDSWLQLLDSFQAFFKFEIACSTCIMNWRAQCKNSDDFWFTTF